MDGWMVRCVCMHVSFDWMYVCYLCKCMTIFVIEFACLHVRVDKGDSSAESKAGNPSAAGYGISWGYDQDQKQS